MKSRSLVLAVQASVCLLVAGIWEVAGQLYPSVFFLVGAPSAVARELWDLITQDDLVSHFLVTGCEAAAGLAIGTVAGSAIGLGLWYSERSAMIAKPFIVGVGALPVFAFAPLMIVWFGVGLKMKIAMATFATIFVTITQSYRGAREVATGLIDVLRGMNASHNQVFSKAIVPGAMGWVFASMRLNGGLALLGAFIGEFIASDRGLGYLILRASGLYNVPRAIAAAVGIVVLALLFDRAAALVEGRRDSLLEMISVPRALWSR